MADKKNDPKPDTTKQPDRTTRTNDGRGDGDKYTGYPPPRKR